MAVGGGQRIAVRQNGALSYLHGDHLSSTSVTTNNTGVKTNDVRYYAYGSQRGTGSIFALPTNHTFTGQKLDRNPLRHIGPSGHAQICAMMGEGLRRAQNNRDALTFPPPMIYVMDLRAYPCNTSRWIEFERKPMGDANADTPRSASRISRVTDSTTKSDRGYFGQTPQSAPPGATSQRQRAH